MMAQMLTVQTVNLSHHWPRSWQVAALFVAAFSLALPAVAADDPARPDLVGRQVLSVAVPDEAARAALFALAESHADVSLADDHLGGDAIEVYASAGGRAALDAAGLTYTVEVADMAAWYEEHFGGVRAGDFFDQYRTYDEHVAFMNDLAASYPDLATVVDIGPTVEGRRQWAIRITGPGNDERPAVLYLGAQHGDEAVNPAVIAWLARHLLSNYGTDPRITDLVDNVEWYLLPIMSPDSYPTSRENANGQDLNRDWDGPGGPPDPFSQPESANLARLIVSRPNMKGLVDLHSAGYLILWPWGHREEYAPDHHTYGMLADMLARSIYSVDGAYYADRGAINTTLYSVRGGSNDYAYGVHGIWSLTYEVNRSKRISPDGIRPTCEELLPSLLRLTDWLWDCNGDGVTDVDELAGGSPDCNGNRTPDYCESQADCDLNGVIDVCQPGMTLPDCERLPEGSTIHVPHDQPTIQDAVTVAGRDAAIVLADGVYTGYGNRNVLLDNFAGVIRSEHGPQDCIIDLEGFERGFLGEALSREARLDGLTIRNGRALDPYLQGGEGGAIRAQARVTNSVITGSLARDGGGAFGGVYDNCRFEGNSARLGGGAYGAELLNCIVTGNHASERGGGAYESDATDSVFSHNSSDKDAGGAGSGRFTGCEFIGNRAAQNGGAVSPGGLYHCQVIDNEAERGGGVAFGYVEASVVSGNRADLGGGLYNAETDRCVVADNTAASEGGGINNGKHFNTLMLGNQAARGGAAYNAKLINCTMIGNHASEAGGGIGGGHDIYNCIIRGNTPDQATGDGITFSNIEGGWPGDGNIDADPLFVDPDGGDYHLQPDSPSINSGKTGSNLTGKVDLDGSPRVQNCFVDMGVYESPYGDVPGCPCTWREEVAVDCDRGNRRKVSIDIHILRGVPRTRLTVRVDGNAGKDRRIKLDRDGAGSKTVRRRAGEIVRVDLVECHAWDSARCD